MDDFYSRTTLLVGEDAIKKIKQSFVVIVGVGGVGGYALECLARSGVGKIRIIDGDLVTVSNKNRQIIALDSTIGKKKVDAFCSRIHDINSNCLVETFGFNLTAQNVSELIDKNADYVVDAIDSVNDKIALIKYCKDNNINIISSMGSGNRYKVPKFEITDVFKTNYDGLAKVVRKKLKDEGIKKHTVIFSPTESIKTTGVVGSISYFPAICGCNIASYVINDLIEEN